MSQRPTLADVLWVFFGGTLGTTARWGIEEVWPARDGQWPIGTFVVNVLGAFLLGALLEWLSRSGDELGRRRIRLIAATGFCGAFTTYSAFALEISLLGQNGHVALALGYALSSLVCGAMAVAAGIAVTRRTLSGRERAA